MATDWMMTLKGRCSMIWLKIVATAAVLTILVAATMPYVAYVFQPPEPVQVGNGPPIESNMRSTPFFVPGIRMPPAVAAHEANLPDDEQVIGVSVEGRHRAYRVGAFADMFTSLVVNDLVGSTPVTVTHCSRNQCTRVFTSDQRGEPLEVATGGWAGKLLLRLNSRYFWQ